MCDIHFVAEFFAGVLFVARANNMMTSGNKAHLIRRVAQAQTHGVDFPDFS